MTIFLVVVHVLVSLFLMLVILVQQGKGADLAGAFGGGGSQTAFGSRGATTILHKLTVGLFVAFIFTSMSLSIIQARPAGSVMTGTAPAEASAPATPGAEPAALPQEEAPAVPAESAPATDQEATPAEPAEAPAQ